MVRGAPSAVERRRSRAVAAVPVRWKRRSKNKPPRRRATDVPTPRPWFASAAALAEKDVIEKSGLLFVNRPYCKTSYSLGEESR